MHPGAPSAPAVGAAQPAAGAPSPGAGPSTARMRVGEMTQLHQQPPPGQGQAVAEPEFAGMDAIEGVGISAQAQALAVLDPNQPDDVLEGQIEVDGEPVTYEQYKELLSKWEADELANELLERFVVAKVDGQPMRIPVREAVQGYQRMSDYSRGMGQLRAAQADVERTRAGFNRLLVDLDQGHTFLQAMRNLNKMPGFEAAAKIFAIQYAKEKLLTPEQREVLAHSRQQEAENYQLKMRLQQLQQAQQQQPQPPNQNEMRLAHQLQQMIPLAAKKVGLPDDPLARDFFTRHWHNLAPTLDGELTTDFVTRVMQAARESYDQAVQQAMTAQAGRPPQVPPVQRLPGAAPVAGAQGIAGQPKRMRVGDMRGTLTRMPGR